MEVEERLKEILDLIQIPSSKAIRGNITLVSEIGEAKIGWKSSNPHIISDKDEGKKKAGVVIRTDQDVDVILKATVSIGEKSISKDIKVRVVKNSPAIKPEDYEAYLFGHFIGEAAENEEQIYFALSEDGLNFRDLSYDKPVLTSNVGEKGVRDPYIYRSYEGDRFFLIATDLSIYNRGGWFQNEQGYYDASTTGSHNLVVWESTDLLNWSEPRLLHVAPENAGMAWAPEIIYDEETGEYIVFFSSSIMNPETGYKSKPNAIYYVTTRDFVSCSEPMLFIDNQSDGTDDGKKREIIDTTLIKIGEWYYSASKDGDNSEKGGGIRILKTKELRNPAGWEKVLDLDELGLNIDGCAVTALDNSMLEGPELFLYNKKDWSNPSVPEYGIMADQYAVGAGYLPLVTTDFEDRDNSNNSWRLLKKDNYSFDRLKKRHGTICSITREEYIRLKKAFE